MKEHKIIFTAELDEKYNRYVITLEHHINWKFEHKELKEHITKVIEAFTDVMSKAYLKATENTNKT